MVARYEVRDDAFRRLVAEDAPVQRIAAGFGFTEGPVWRGDHLLFSDIPNKRIVRWRRLPEGPELTTYATGSSNGLTLDRQGNVVAAEHDGRRVTRIADGGRRTVLAERFEGKRLNSPNDIVVKSDGSIYFTDPPYGLTGRSELGFYGVFRLAPDGKLLLLARDIGYPNGLAFSPDEKLLYGVTGCR